MIDRDYVVTMARYNGWQNTQLSEIVTWMDEAAVIMDRGAFFGSILGTLNHLLWGDSIWMSRWDDGVEAPQTGIPDSPALTGTVRAWWAARQVLDARITAWAAALTEEQLGGELSWYSGAQQRDVTRPMAVCVAHMFNHQTHHRGQIHAMLTAAGQRAPTTDLVFMPEEL